MPFTRSLPRHAARLAVAALALSAAGALQAAGDVAVAVAVAAPAAAELKFREFFRMPIGPRGLEVTERLAALQGQRVTITGYLARPHVDEASAGGHGHGHAAAKDAAAVPPHGYAILAPFPIALGDDDEHLVDDLPPNALFVHAPPAVRAALAWRPGPVQVTGVLELGNRQEAGDRVSTVRLTIDSPAAVVPVVPRQASR